MSIEVEYSNDELKLEERVFFLSTWGGRSLTASVSTALAVLYCVVFLSVGGKDFSLLEEVGVAIASMILAIMTVFLGYFWMSSGGHVSSYFEMKGSRTYMIVEKMKVLKVNDFGSIKEISLEKCRILQRPGQVFVISNSKVYFIPVTDRTKEFIESLKNFLSKHR